MEIHRLEAPGVSADEWIGVRDRMARFYVEEYGIPEGPRIQKTCSGR